MTDTLREAAEEAARLLRTFAPLGEEGSKVKLGLANLAGCGKIHGEPRLSG